MISAVIFDLDGVLVSTDEYHYLAWKQMAKDEGIVFNREINEALRGVSRMDSLDIVLSHAVKEYTLEEKKMLAKKKNEIYVKLIHTLQPKDMLPGAKKTIEALKAAGIKIAIGSSSKNTPAILEQIELTDYFDAIADGNNITKSKPDPEVFLLAAHLLNKTPEECLVIEDAQSGLEAAISAGMLVLGVGSASSSLQATIRAKSLKDISVLDWINQRNR
ncbi:MAG: beta-phosphoglucomutase [Clostridiales bacterium]|nr:beta-phosphoglucomutase [Clostridiales bacterium]